MMVLSFYILVFKILSCWRLMYVFIILDKFMVTEWPPIGKIAAHFMFSWYKYLIVNLVFSHLGFWSANLFLIAPFPDLCLLVLFSERVKKYDLIRLNEYVNVKVDMIDRRRGGVEYSQCVDQFQIITSGVRRVARFRI